MLDLIQPIIDGLGAAFVRLDGSVPQKKRQGLVNRFQSDPACRLFLATNAGSTGLNLQAADTVVNVDLPWNPAVLDPDSPVDQVNLSAGVEDLRRRLEVLTGTGAAPVDESMRQEAVREVLRARRDEVARAGGTLLSAAFSFVGEVLGPKAAESAGTTETAQRFQELLADCVQKNNDGSLSMTVRFPDEKALQGLAAVLGRIAAQAGGTGRATEG